MKKFLSVFVAVSMLSALFVCNASAANTSRTVTAGDFTVSTGGLVTDGPTGYVFSTNASSAAYGNAILSKKAGIYGLSAGEYGLMLIAGRQKADKPYISFNFGDIDASEDFYITTNAYIGMQPENDYMRLGTTLTKEDGTELENGQNFQGFKHFYGNGKVKFRVDGNTETKFMNASYTANNWVNYTIAGTGGTITVYIDGVGLTSGYVEGISGGNKTASYSGILKDVSPAIRLCTSNSGELGDIPSIAVFKDMKLVAGTYDPEQSKTNITSAKYTVPAATAMLGTSVENPDKVKPIISGVSESETVSEFLADITAPAGSTKSVVRVNDQTGATTVAANSEAMSSDMKLLIRSADGSMKLYSIRVGLAGALYFDTTGYTEGGYSIDDTNKVITVMPHTTAETLTAILKTNSPDVTYSILRKNGEEYSSGALTSNMKVQVSKAGKSVKYSIAFKTTLALNTAAKLGTVSDGTVVFSANGMDDVYDYTGKGLLGLNHSTAGYTQMQKANSSVTPAGSYTVTKENMPGHTADNRVDAWHFAESGNTTGGWRMHSSNALGMHSATASDKGKKTVIAFKAYLEEGGGFSIAPRHAYGTKPDCTDIQYKNTPNTGTGDRITFTGGDIKIGGQNRDYSLASYTGNYMEIISAYGAEEEYDVAVVESRGETEVDGALYPTVVTEAVYVNGFNVLSAPKTMVIKDGRDYFAIRDMTLQTVGEVYIGGLRVYMADEYSITAAGVDDGEAPAEPEEQEETLTYDWTPDEEAVTDVFKYAPENEIVIVTDEITNYFGTVGTLKSMLDSGINTRIEVVNGNTASATVYSDNQALAANMYVRISDVNNSENCSYYRLTTAISSDMRVENLYMSKVEEFITASRVVKTYRTEPGKRAKLIGVTYDAAGKLTDISVDEKDITSANTYKFSVGVYEGAQTKIMLWLDAMEPYGAATTYSE